MTDIMYITSAHYLTVNKQQDGVVQNAFKIEFTSIITQPIHTLCANKNFLINLRMKVKTSRRII